MEGNHILRLGVFDFWDYPKTKRGIMGYLKLRNIPYKSDVERSTIVFVIDCKGLDCKAIYDMGNAFGKIHADELLESTVV